MSSLDPIPSNELIILLYCKRTYRYSDRVLIIKNFFLKLILNNFYTYINYLSNANLSYSYFEYIIF